MLSECLYRKRKSLKKMESAREAKYDRKSKLSIAESSNSYGPLDYDFRGVRSTHQQSAVASPLPLVISNPKLAPDKSSTSQYIASTANIRHDDVVSKDPIYRQPSLDLQQEFYDSEIVAERQDYASVANGHRKVIPVDSNNVATDRL